eukprot:14410397-Heterocapsa_arctica.AAC.1
MTRDLMTSTTECQGMRSSISTCADRLMETRNNIKASRCAVGSRCDWREGMACGLSARTTP